MRPNLSLERLAAIVAALGTSAVLASCAKGDSAAVRADQTPRAQSATPTVSAAPGGSAPSAELAPSPVAPTVTAAAASSGLLREEKKGKAMTGQASCGAGTCTADPKKK
jgi:hypothetical protein